MGLSYQSKRDCNIRERGNGNRGHRYGADLDEQQVEALLDI